MLQRVIRIRLCRFRICTNSKHGRRKGGFGHPLDFENFIKKSYFLNFEWEKTNFTTFVPPGKILEKSPSAPPGKNPSDARDSKYVCLHQVFHTKWVHLAWRSMLLITFGRGSQWLITFRCQSCWLVSSEIATLAAVVREGTFVIKNGYTYVKPLNWSSRGWSTDTLLDSYVPRLRFVLTTWWYIFERNSNLTGGWILIFSWFAFLVQMNWCRLFNA